MIEQYIQENEPTEVIRDELGRWLKRIWVTETSTIEETYVYKYTVEEVNEDPLNRRDSFTVLSTELKEVQNG